MKKILITITLFLASCGFQARHHYSNCSIEKVESGTQITCGSEVVVIPNPQDGIDGEDGKTPVMLTKFTLEKNTCSEVSPGIYAENINNGELFDVYATSDCKDSSGGEYCDNVTTSFGNDTVGGDGSSSICWVDNLQFSGVKQDNGDILIYILEFKE